MVCPFCNEEIADGALKCKHCKSLLTEEKGSNDNCFCSSCGISMKRDAHVCPECGVINKSNVNNKRSKIAAGLFALFLGGFGVHKFYLGKTAQGVVYLLFCWTLIPSLIAFVEGILYLTSSDAAFDLKYNTN